MQNFNIGDRVVYTNPDSHISIRGVISSIDWRGAFIYIGDESHLGAAVSDMIGPVPQSQITKA